MNSGLTNSYYVAELSWYEVEQKLIKEFLSVLPIGAACKQHGHHLPLNTDCIQAEWLAKNLTLGRSVLIWPTVTYGYYPAFINFPGSCSISEDTFSQSVRDILQGIVKAGAGQILLINTGISTINPLQDAIKLMGEKNNLILFNVYSGTCFSQALTAYEKQPVGHHADEVETSIMLAIAPELVDMDKADCFLEKIEDGPLNRSNPNLPNYTPSGVLGDATLATAEKGRIFLEAIQTDLDQVLI